MQVIYNFEWPLVWLKILLCPPHELCNNPFNFYAYLYWLLHRDFHCSLWLSCLYILNGFSLPLEEDPFPLAWPTTPCKTWLLPIFLTPNLVISLYPVGSISQDSTQLFEHVKPFLASELYACSCLFHLFTALIYSTHSCSPHLLSFGLRGTSYSGFPSSPHLKTDSILRIYIFFLS